MVLALWLIYLRPDCTRTMPIRLMVKSTQKAGLASLASTQLKATSAAVTTHPTRPFAEVSWRPNLGQFQPIHTRCAQWTRPNWWTQWHTQTTWSLRVKASMEAAATITRLYRRQQWPTPPITQPWCLNSSRILVVWQWPIAPTMVTTNNKTKTFRASIIELPVHSTVETPVISTKDPPHL